MKKSIAVIGANFGDEGKGLMTDYFSKAFGGIVVRYNGGSQASHTVVTPEGDRHVFSTYGAGTFAGLPTYLSRFFIINPIIMMKETRTLKRSTDLYIDSNCLITIPFDMLVNQIIEKCRGKDKHGSCGIGFGETIERCITSRHFDLRISDLSDLDSFKIKIKQIRTLYTPYRLHKLGLTDDQISEEYKHFLFSEDVIEHYLDDVTEMLKIVKVTGRDVLNKFDTIIFEGSQGLLLDQEHSFFPHVTRSHTGLLNISELTGSLGVEKMNVTYVTRCYMTRHGDGQFPTEIPGKPYNNVIDTTNVTNTYQGSLRFGLLDLDYLNKSIQEDLKKVGQEGFKFNIAVTCLDQIDNPDSVKYILDNTVRTTSIDDFINEITKFAENVYTVYGPTRDHVKVKRVKRKNN